MLIADSGSTKTDWRWIDDNNKPHQYSTIGFNPFFQDTAAISAELRNNLVSHLNSDILNSKFNIFFYGAGCSSAERCGIIGKALKAHFPAATIEVEHDLLGAARALCGHSEGIAAILGTGSNSCYYDGETIIEHIASLGFILGDEGSGAHIGKSFIQAYLNKELPTGLASKFFNEFGLQRDDILEAIYKKPMPSRYLASFAQFIHKNIQEPYLINLVGNCFEQFFEKHICKYSKHKETKMNAVGSVGFYFRDILSKIASNKGIELGKIIETPISELVRYHTGTI